MKRLLITTVCWLCLGTAPAADLMAVYQRALQNDPQLREAEANRLAALEAKPQAVAALLPQINGQRQATRERDTGPRTTVQAVSGVTGTGGQLVYESFPFDGRTNTTSHRYGVDLRAEPVPLGELGRPAARRRPGSTGRGRLSGRPAGPDRTRVAALLRRARRAGRPLGAGGRAGLHQPPARTGREATTKSGSSRSPTCRRRAPRTTAASPPSSTPSASWPPRGRNCAEITGELFESLARPDRALRLANPDPVSEDHWVDMALQQNLVARIEPPGRRHRAREHQHGRGRPFSHAGSGRQPLQDHDRRSSYYTNGNLAASAIADQDSRSIGLQLTSRCIPADGFLQGAPGGIPAPGGQGAARAGRARDRARRARRVLGGALGDLAGERLKRAVESNYVALQATEAGYEAGTRTAVDVLNRGACGYWPRPTTRAAAMTI